jgi:hypothetical protein
MKTYTPRALARLLLVAVAFPTTVALAEPKQADEKPKAPAAEAPLLKQPTMPMRRTTHKQREDSAKKLKALRDADAQSKGQAPKPERQMPKPQRLPESRDSK